MENNTDIEVNEDDLFFNPYNNNNKEITESDILLLFQKYGIPSKVHNMELYKRAFIHVSYTKKPMLENEKENIILADKPQDCLPLKTKSNERLEFLGDGVLELLTKYYLYRRFPKADEGFMTEKKIALVKNEHIGKLAYEMGLNKWYIISKHAEEKKIRTNLKKLGCLFEAFLGALFLDFNKINIKDDEKWFENIFVTGPGFQIAQIFVEKIFEQHVNWTELIENDDNYKNKLQVLLQKEFKVTPNYIIHENTLEEGYTMGVYLCVGQNVYEVNMEDAVNYEYYGSFANIQTHLEEHDKCFIFLGKGKHKIKKKAEQIACEEGIHKILG